NTMPPETLKAVRDHGRVRRTIDEGLDEARATLATLEVAGIDLGAATQQLEDEGVALFSRSFNELLATVERKRQARLQEQHEAADRGDSAQIASEESFPASDAPGHAPVVNGHAGRGNPADA